jgi:hypothetical protein
VLRGGGNKGAEGGRGTAVTERGGAHVTEGGALQRRGHGYLLQW